MEKFTGITLDSFYKKTTLHVIVLSDGVVIPKKITTSDPYPEAKKLREFFKAVDAFAEGRAFIGTMGSETALLINCSVDEFVMNVGVIMADVSGDKPYVVYKDAKTVKSILSKECSFDYDPETYKALMKKGFLPKIELPKEETKPMEEGDKSEEIESDEEKTSETSEDEDEEDEELESDEEEAVRTAATGATSSPEYSGIPLEKKIYKKIVDAVHPSDAAEDKIVQDLAKDIVKSILTDMGVIS